MYPVQARRNSCSVIGHDQVPGPDQFDQSRTRQVSNRAAGFDDHNPGARRALDWFDGGDHSSFFLRGHSDLNGARVSAVSMVAINSRAAISGALSVVRSASGMAIACIGVSMSPGSKERKCVPSADNSWFQISVMWRRPALLAP